MARSRWLLVALAAWSLAVVGPATAAQAGPAHAASTTLPADSIVLSPATKTLDVEAGDSVVHVVSLRNEAIAARRFGIELSDVASASGDDLPYVVLHGIQRDAATWVSTRTPTVVVPGGGEVDVELEVRVPSSAEPGSHLFAVSARELDPPGTVSAGAIRPIAILTSITVVDLPGERPEGGDIDLRMTPTGWRWAADSVEVRFEFRNKGAYVLRPQGEVRLVDARGEVVTARKVARFSVLPGGRHREVLELARVPRVGRVAARIELRSEQGTLRARTEPLTLLPAWLVAATCAVLLATVAAVIVAVRRRRAWRRYLVVAGDEIEAVVDDDRHDP